jgi:hypothetical protein
MISSSNACFFSRRLNYFEFRVMTFEAIGIPPPDKTRSRGGPFGQLPRVPTYKGHEDDTGIPGNTMPVNVGYHM